MLDIFRYILERHRAAAVLPLDVDEAMLPAYARGAADFAVFAASYLRDNPVVSHGYYDGNTVLLSPAQQMGADSRPVPITHGRGGASMQGMSVDNSSIPI